MNNDRLIIYIYRSKKHREFSIEKVFSQIEESFYSKNVYMPFKSNLSGVFLNLLFMASIRYRFKSNSIFHITGDVYYLNLVLPSNRTVTTFHDCGVLIRSKGLKKIIIYFLWYKLPLRKSKYITTISELVLRQLVKIHPKSRSKIALIFNPLRYV